MENDLQERVYQFGSLSLPGQPRMMHMGTSYLVNDLWNEVKRLREENARLRTAIHDAINRPMGVVPDSAVEFYNIKKGGKVKPYFCPLKREYFNKIKTHIQRSEIRPNGHHGWNVKNIYPGRQILFSLGYRKTDRFLREIRNTIVTHDLRQEDVSVNHIEAVEAIYGKRDSWLVARVL